MGLGFYLSIAMLPVMIIITTIFFLKEKLNNEETEIYAYILLSSIAMTLFEILSAILFESAFGSFVYNLIAKMVLVSYIVVNYLFCQYMMNVCKKPKSRINLLRVITIITLIITIITKTEYIESNGAVAPSGIPIALTYGYAIGNGIYLLILTIKNRKSIIAKKFTPFYLFLFFGLINDLIIYFYPTSFVVGYIWCLTILVMNFTIENPDVKLAKELAFQRELADESSDKTFKLLNEISDDLKLSVKKLDTIGNKKVDKNNIDELNKELAEFQDTSTKLSDKISGILDLAMIKGNQNIKEYKYETYDMLDNLKQLILLNQEDNNKLNIEISDDLPPVLYGDENNVIKIVLYFFNLITSITNDQNLTLKIDDTQVGRFSRLKFNFETNDLSIQDYIYPNRDTKELELVKDHDLNYEIIQNLIKRFKGKIIVLKRENSTNISLCINQRLLSEYEIISNKEENRNVKIKYSDFSGKRILIVDNSNVKIKEMRVLLKPYNIEVYSVDTPNQMSELLDDNATFDMILIDDIIPNFKLDDFTNEIVRSKDDLLRHIKREAKYPITTIIMVTPNSENMEQKYLNYGFSDCITKPINKSNLDKLLKKYFNDNSHK